MNSRLKQIICALLGTLFLGVGIVGMVLPLLPTTPFLLLTAFLYAHSYPRLLEKLMANRFTGPIINDFRVHRAITLHKKLIILSTLWGTMLFNILFLVEFIWVKVMLVTIAVAVSTHILSYKTRR